MSDTTLQSHMPILEFLLEQFEINAALEFGCGLYSTPLLVRRCRFVVSMEMNSKEWIEKVTEQSATWELGGVVWQMFWMEGPTAAIEYVSPGSSFDLALCDGHGDTRSSQAACMINRAGIIVVHDSQHPETNRGLDYIACSDLDYTRINFKDWRKPADLPAGDVWPWTTVLVNDPDRAKVITEWRDAG